MIKSMTGYGRADAKTNDGQVVAEIKSVNHKYFDLVLRVAPELNLFEEKIKELLQRKIKRGRINLTLYFEGRKGVMTGLGIDEAAAINHYRQLNRLANKLGLKERVSLDNILVFSDAIIYKQRRDITKIWPLIKKALIKAEDALIKSKSNEGTALYKDIISEINKIDLAADKIKRFQPRSIARYRNKLLKLSRQLSKKTTFDKGRLEMEVALFAKNCDIQEELVRMKAHLKNFKAGLKANREIGKELDFTAQEIFRETNTIASKAEDFNIQNAAIGVKSSLEKVREQLSNVE